MTTCTDSDLRAGIMSSITFFTRVNASKQILNANVASRELWSLSAIADNSSEACVLRSECIAIDFCSNESLKVLVNKSWSSSLIKIAVAFSSLSISNWRVFWWWWMLNLLFVASDGDGCSTCYMWLAIYVHYLFHLTSHTFSSKLFSAINTLHSQFRSQKYFAVIILCHQDVYGTSFFCHQWGCQSGVSICLHIKAECQYHTFCPSFW